MSILKTELFDKLENTFPEMVDFRRDLHMYPELSFQEEMTPQKIAAFLVDLGLAVKTGVGGKGVVGILRGGLPGKTVALRADFDALPIQDEKDVPYKSRIPGVMHACGHDIHTAALLGVAKVLSEVKDKIKGNVVFIHQFAEEVIPGGAKAMIEDGCLEGVDVIYGAHVSSLNPNGTIAVREGYSMAATDRFEIEVVGKGGHGATPHLTVDPLLTGCQLAFNLQQIVSRRVDPVKPAVVTIGKFISGNAFNVIPNSSKLEGTVRTFDEGTRDLVEESIKQIAKSTCDAAGAEARIVYERGYPAVNNDPKETQRIKNLAENLFGKEKVFVKDIAMGGEDFAYYLQKVPGTFFHVGARNSEIGATFPHHHPQFDVDEESMLVIGKLFIEAVLHYLESE